MKIEGHCPICEIEVVFLSENSWYRDYLLCSNCESLPRERALMHVINTYYPHYKKLRIHESSPSNRGVSEKFRSECSEYTFSHYYPDIPLGSYHLGDECRCENLEKLTFEDEYFDLFITQDVMEHIFDPKMALKQISRVLKPGGAHIFTVPMINKENKSECWASKSEAGEIIYHHEPEYHGNPIDGNGSLVTMHWGYDLASYIMKVANTPTTIVMIDNLQLGIRAEYIEVLVSVKD